MARRGGRAVTGRAENLTTDYTDRTDQGWMDENEKGVALLDSGANILRRPYLNMGLSGLPRLRMLATKSRSSSSLNALIRPGHHRLRPRLARGDFGVGRAERLACRR